MPILPIIYAPDAVLREVAQPVKAVTPDILDLLENMAQTMYDAQGIGLAANQVGKLVRVIVMDCSQEDEPPQLWKMINPEITHKSETLATGEEGCLSLPSHRGEVTRAEAVDILYTDIHNKKQTLKATGLLAICVQHEIDHLNGILFIDHLSRLKRDMIWRKIVKEAKR